MEIPRLTLIAQLLSLSNSSAISVVYQFEIKFATVLYSRINRKWQQSKPCHFYSFVGAGLFLSLVALVVAWVSKAATKLIWGRKMR